MEEIGGLIFKVLGYNLDLVVWNENVKWIIVICRYCKWVWINKDMYIFKLISKFVRLEFLIDIELVFLIF